MNHQAGFVNIIGNPNVGKSTLMNVLIGEKLSIISSKAQTTRHRILGIVNGKDYQIIYSDTPGIIKPAYKMQESMMQSVESALQDADIFLLLTDVYDKFTDKKILDLLNASTTPVMVVVNKLDLVDQDKVNEKLDAWKALLPKAEVMPISALIKFNIDKLTDYVLEHLPESPAYFDKEELTDRSERYFVSEIIREKILLNYNKEVPYSVEIEVESFKEEEKIVKIRAIIYVARDSQKGIIIGKGGDALKRTGTQARKDIEEFLGKQVYLELYVKVSKDWRNDERQLKKFGYFNQ